MLYKVIEGNFQTHFKRRIILEIYIKNIEITINNKNNWKIVAWNNIEIYQIW